MPWTTVAQSVLNWLVRGLAGHKYAAEEASLVGNTCLYGATGGRLFVNGRAGERFAVRNSMAQVRLCPASLHSSPRPPDCL